MATTRSIVVSVDQETHRRARIRAEQLKVSVPELAAAALASAVGQVDIAEPSHEREGFAKVRTFGELVDAIRQAHPGFRAADNLPRGEIYARALRGSG